MSEFNSRDRVDDEDRTTVTEEPAASPTDSESEAPADIAPAADPIADLTRERDDYYDRLLRKTAEFDNYRKRVERERRERADAAASDLLRDLLLLVDDFDRALQTDAAEQPDAYQRGIELIHKQLMDLLRKRGVTPIEALGTDFDPHLHQAVAHEASPGNRDGEVIEEFRRGYKLGDRLLRPAMVKVAKA
jgi:molecular chaperone GrpE